MSDPNADRNLLFGVLAFIWPEPTVFVLVALFAGYALVDGVSLLISLVRGDPDARRNGWAVGIMGVIGVIAAIVAFDPLSLARCAAALIDAVAGTATSALVNSRLLVIQTLRIRPTCA